MKEGHLISVIVHQHRDRRHLQRGGRGGRRLHDEVCLQEDKVQICIKQLKSIMF